MDYTGTLDVKPKGSGSSVEWRVQYLPDNQPDFVVKTIVATLLKTGLEASKNALEPRNDRRATKSISMYPLTDGEIAVNNLESARQQSWSQFWREPLRPGIAESIVEQEQLTLQFLSDLAALVRVGSLINQLDHVDPESPRTALVNAQVASMTHRFADARTFLAKAEDCEELADAANRVLLSIDQACGTALDCARSQTANGCGVRETGRSCAARSALR